MKTVMEGAVPAARHAQKSAHATFFFSQVNQPHYDVSARYTMQQTSLGPFSGAMPENTAVSLWDSQARPSAPAVIAFGRYTRPPP